MSANKVTFGLEQVHIAFFDDETEPTWEKPIPVPGAVRWTPTAEGESTTHYADNIAYFTVTSNNGYTGELEMTLLPDEIRARMLGWEVDENGAIIEVADGIPEKFALMGQVQGDKRNRRFVYYNTQAARPAKEHSTKGDTTDVATDVLPVTVSPIKLGGKTIVKGDLERSDENKTIFDDFFEEVYTPVFGVEA